jgi:trigger factor
LKKKFLALLISASVLLLAGGCGSNSVKATSTTQTNQPAATSANASTATTPAAITKGEFAVDDFIKLGKYKGIEVTVNKTEVTDSAVTEAIQAELNAHATEENVTGRSVEKGDNVNIDYVGLKDGVAFEGGTAAGYDLLIGSGSFIPGFEDGLMGHNIGEKVAVNLTFPANYQAADLAGKAVVFNVTINAIKQPVIPTLTEEYVKNNTTFASIDAYKESIKADLQTKNEENQKNQMTSDVLGAVVANSKIMSFPQTLIDYYKNDFAIQYTQYASSNGMDLTSFLDASNITQEDFNKQTLDYANSMATQELVITSIIKTEKVTLSDEEFNTGVDKIIKQYSIASKDDLFKKVPESKIRESLLWQKTLDFVISQAIQKS